MGLFSTIMDTATNTANKAFGALPKEVQGVAKLGVSVMDPSIFTAMAGMDLWAEYRRGQNAGGWNGGYGGAGGFEFAWPEFAMAEFTPVEPMGEINVNALLDEMAGINRKTTETNFGIAQTMGRKVADNAFTDFTAFLDKVLPEAGKLTRSVAREAQNFIDRGLPSAVMGNAILRDSAMFAATGTRGGVAVRRGLANEASRDTAAVQYGMGVAQQLVNDARSTALPFAQLGAEATQSNLGLLTNLTAISPAQRIGMAFDERNYQTGVAQFNAGTAAGVSQFNAGQANSMAVSAAQLGMQQQQMNMEMAMYQQTLAAQQKAARDAKSASMWSILATVGGAAAGFAVGGPVGAAVGAQAGGGLGQMYGGYSTGNYGLMSQGLSNGLGAYGTYTSWQSQQQNLKMQNSMLNLYQMQLDDARDQRDLLFNSRMSGGGTLLPASSRNPFNIG
jgi:hypothetical protein